MTIRGYVAIFYGLMAGVLSVAAYADADRGHLLAVTEDATAVLYLDEIEPDLSGWERDDLPAYLTEDEADHARAAESAALAADETL